jgi:phospholipase/lecithinase/hemolysin
MVARMFRLFSLILLFFCSNVLAQISNMIVFGDSLSDGGNFPESSQIWKNPGAKKDLSNAVAQIYVPFSNPVNTQNNDAAWPTLDDHYLSKQAPLGDQKTPRTYRSISWPQFFLYEAQLKHIAFSQLIAPSELIHARTIAPQISFNYAWGFALSGFQCANPYYQPIKNCTQQTIDAAKANYLSSETPANYAAIEIPGLSTQMNLFLHDVQSKKVVVDKNTLYTFWIGGNDLIVASNALLHHKNPFPLLHFALGNVASHVLDNIAILLRSLPTTARPAKLYVFTLFNPGLTPTYYHTALGHLGNFLVHCANAWLRWDVAIFNLFSKTKIIVVPTNGWFLESAADPAFIWHAGQACQFAGGNYTDPNNIPVSNCAGFMFWNAVHPATPMNTIIAKRLTKILLDYH